MHSFTASTQTSTPGEIPSRNTSRAVRTLRDPERDAEAPASEAPLSLAPGARVLWRDARVTQWELPGRALVVEGAGSAEVAALLGSAPNSPPTPSERASQAELGRVRTQLQRAGFLWRPSGGIGASPPRAQRGSPRLPPMPERLLADVQALAARFGDDAANVMGARRTRAVQIIGADRLATTIAALLAAAGIGRLELPAAGAARLEHAMPGGLSPADEGRPWSEAASDAILRAAPESHVGVVPAPGAPDLVVVVGARPMAEELRDELHADAQPYLCVGVDGAHAVIGPLVVPGWSSCVRCLELHRRDRDPAWWALAAQLSTAARRTAPSDVSLCAIVAGFAVSQALSLLDGEPPTTLDATIEMTLPDWRMRRRTRPRHPECGCISG